MKRVVSVLFFAILLIGQNSLADSPATSTTFSEAYKDVALVQRALANHALDAETMAYLSRSKGTRENPNRIDHKGAIISAIDFGYASSAASAYISYLTTTHQKDLEKVPSTSTDLDGTKYPYFNLVDARLLGNGVLNGDELFSLGYLLLLGYYDTPNYSYDILELASEKKPRSLTVAVIFGIASAQRSFHNKGWSDGPNPDMCHEFSSAFIKAGAIASGGTDELKEDMQRTLATKIIADYMKLYGCPTTSFEVPE